MLMIRELIAGLVLHTGISTYLGLLTGQVQAEEALSKGIVQMKEDSPRSLSRRWPAF